MCLVGILMCTPGIRSGGYPDDLPHRLEENILDPLYRRFISSAYIKYIKPRTNLDPGKSWVTGRFRMAPSAGAKPW